MHFFVFQHQTGMKKHVFVTFIFLIAAFLLHAQSDTVTLYGFKQRTTGGMQKKGDIDETGRLKKAAPTEVFQYAIYLATQRKTRIYPVQLWINGEAFAVKSEWIAAAQLMDKYADRHYERMQPIVTAAQGIWKLTPIPLAVDKSGGRAKALAISNDVVVLYKSSGKLRYGVLKKFTELDPVALQ
jgi:hypothetical protein